MENPSVLILAASLDANSRSFLLAEEAYRVLRSREIDSTLVDLRTLCIPLCPTDDPSAANDLPQLRFAMARASHLLFAVPVYNWDVNAAAKNVVEWMGEAELGGKTVGFLCAAGGNSSYMSVMSFANSLMLDFRCWIVPRFVYAVGSDFDADSIVNPQVRVRIERLTEEMFYGGLPGRTGA